MICASKVKTDVSQRLERAIAELQSLHEVLSCEKVDGEILTDVRDALNRVCNTAWVTQNCVSSKLLDGNPAPIASLLAAEHIRTAFQLCRSVREDLKREDVQFQRSQLLELEAAVRELSKQLDERI